MGNTLRVTLKSGARQLFELAQKAGVNVLPNHFYSEIPNIRRLRAEDYWRSEMSMIAVEGCDIDEQLTFLEHCTTRGGGERLDSLGLYQRSVAENGVSGGYGPVEADFLYCFIRSERPDRIVQVGSGVSTSVILLAAKDAGYQPQVICVDPYPTPFLTTAAASSAITLLEMEAQKVPVDIFTELADGDLLFVDSTHTVKPGSEVNRIILEIMPRLSAGVYVHFHDIYFPYDYPRDLLGGRLFFWSESTLLHAYLIGNSGIKIRTSLSMIHYANPERLRKSIPIYKPQDNDCGLRGQGGEHFPSSIYLEVV